MRLTLLFSILFFAITSFAQEHSTPAAKRDTPTYVKYPEMPAFNIRKLDSFTVFNTFYIPTGRPSMLIFFDPECAHCVLMTQELMRGIDSISNIDMYWITPNHSVSTLRKFCKDNNFEAHKNIILAGRDYEFFFSDYFDVHFIPDIALYDENKQFIHLFENRATVKELYEYTHRK